MYHKNKGFSVLGGFSKEKLRSTPMYFFDKLNSLSWEKYSRLIIKSDGADWVLSSITKEMHEVCKSLDITTISSRNLHNTKDQCVFFTSKYELLMKWREVNHRVAFPYFHGIPDTDPKFKIMFETIKKHHNQISRIQVSHSQMQEIILDSGIHQSKVHRIPISIDLNLFPSVTSEKRKQSRNQLGIPDSAILVGSFQKDGVGWGQGMSPKLIKGPDILIKSLELLKLDFPEIFVLLTGSSRGYVISNLERIGIPYKYVNLSNYEDIVKCYHALDLYIVSSREEGGPRAILESMASGIPILSTKVGQAIDLIENDKNGWLVEIEDFESLANKAKYILEHNRLDNILMNARITAEKNCYASQLNLWREFMNGFVDT